MQERLDQVKTKQECSPEWSGLFGRVVSFSPILSFFRCEDFLQGLRALNIKGILRAIFVPTLFAG